MFDVIMSRRFDDTFKTDMKRVVDLGVKLSDGIVFISKFTQDDFMARYVNEGFVKDKLYKVIYPSTEFGLPEETDYDVPFEQYFLIVGNMFEHKVLKETIDTVADSGHNYIVIGYGESDYIYPNVFGYMNGLIDDDFLRYLYSKSNAVIFPSLYEGFGFPIVMALINNKQIIVNNNCLNNELSQNYPQFKDYFSFYDRFEQINDIVDKLDYSVESLDIKFDDSWERAAVELDDFFEEVFDIEFNAEALNERSNAYDIIDAEKMITYNEILQKSNAFTDRVAAELEILYKQFGNYKIIPMLKFALKKHLKHRFSRLFNLLKSEKVSKFTALLFQFIKFALVGVTNFIVTLSIYYLFIWFNPALYQIGNLVGWIAGIINAFLLNRKFVFKKSTEYPLKTLGKTFIIYAFTYLLTAGMLHAQIEWLGISAVIAPLICMLVTVPINFFASKFWAFRSKKKEADSKPER